MAGEAAAESNTPVPDEVDAGIEAMREERPFELVDSAQSDEPKPEPKKEEPPKQEVKEEPKKPVRLVPHEALHEERSKRQQLEKRLADMEKAQAQPRQEPEQSDDVDENLDPIGAIARLKAEIRKGQEEQAAETQRRNFVAELGRRTNERINSYKAEHPEYDDQLQYVRRSRFEELQLLGAAPEAALEQLQLEEMQIAHMMLQQDGDLGAHVAKLAVHRGWKAAEPAKEESKQVETSQEDVAKIERLQKGHRVAKSSSGAGGGAPSSEMSLEDIANLDGAAFDKAFEAHAKRLMA